MEWPLVHHHAELEMVLNVIQHKEVVDEFGALLCKIPLLHVSKQLELTVGFGGIIETIQHLPYVGVEADIGSRFWFTPHWGVSAEVGYIYLLDDLLDSTLEGIFEVLYRF